MNWPWTAWEHKPKTDEEIAKSAKIQRMHEKTIARIKEELFRDRTFFEWGLHNEMPVTYMTDVVNGIPTITLGGVQYNFTSKSGEVYELYVQHKPTPVKTF